MSGLFLWELISFIFWGVTYTYSLQTQNKKQTQKKNKK